MSQFNGFDCFIGDLVNGAHNLHRDCLAVMLTNEQPKPSYGTRSQIKEIENAAGANPYGIQVLGIRSETNGAKFTLFGDDTCFTCSGDSFGPFRYAVLYNASSAANNLIGWWDYGASVTLVRGETFIVDFDEKHGILQIEGMPSTPAQGKTHDEILDEELATHAVQDWRKATLVAMSRVSAPLVVTEDMVNDLEERLAWALEEADLKPGDLVTVNRKKLNIISRNALTAALPHMQGAAGEGEENWFLSKDGVPYRVLDTRINYEKAQKAFSRFDKKAQP